MSCISQKIRPQNSLAFYDFTANSLMDGAPNAVSKLENSTVLLYFRLFDAGRSDQPFSARKIKETDAVFDDESGGERKQRQTNSNTVQTAL